MEKYSSEFYRKRTGTLVRSLQPALGDEAVANDQAGDDHADDAHQFDEDVQAGTAGIFEGIADGVTHHGRFVCGRTLATQFAALDVFLGVVPRASGIGHEQSHAETGRE